MANDIGRLLEMHQTGAYIPTKEEEENTKQLEQAMTDNVRWSTPKPGPGFQTLRLSPEGEMRNESLGLEAAASGWGQSRYDRGEYNPEADIEHKRAIEQSGFAKIINGAMKGGIYAATTAVETVAGVFDGLLEGGYELVRQAATNDTISLPKAIGAGVDNFTARSMANIQKLSDEWFPNYRTLEERSPEYQDQWLKHIFTANFIGDSFLKNFGFTVGAIAGGAAWSRVLGAALRAGAASDLMKGVTAAAEGDATAKAALQTTLANVNAGTAMTVDATAAMKNLKTAAKSLNKMSAKQQLFGSVIGAMGEGTMEGVMARNEFMDSYGNDLYQEFVSNYQNLRDDLTEGLKDTDAVRTVPVLDENGNVVDIRYELNEKGEEQLARQQRELASDYAKKKAWADDQADRLASTTFLLNLPILTVSNTLQFGRMFSGGWKTTRNNLAKVAGKTTAQGEKLLASYVPEGNMALRIAGNAAKVGATEASEEMLQGMVSSGARRVADTRLTSFNDDGYDRRTLSDIGSWYNAMFEGSKDYLSDWKNWQEGFLGMITGLVGIPGRHWNGGLAEAVREGREEARASKSAADILNAAVNSERFQNAWKGYVRHGKYESDMTEAVMNDDQYSWQTANDKQLINDVMMFADAGRLQDLYDIVDGYANITEEQAASMEVPEAVLSARSENDVLNNPKDVVAKVKEQAQNIKDTIEMYNDIYDSMSALAPVDTTPDQLRELIATSMNIKAFEKRFLSMFDDVIKGMEKYVGPLSAVNNAGEPINNAAEQLNRAKEIYSALAQIYTGTGIPVDTPIVDALGTIATLNALESSIEKAGDTALLKQIEDMKKVAADRKAYLKKLTTLRELSPESYEEQKETPEGVIAEQDVAQAQAETEGLKTFQDYKKRYIEKDARGKADFVATIEPLAATTSAANTFLKFKNRFDGFKKYVSDSGINVPDEYAQLINQSMISGVVNDLFYRTNSEQELMSLPDTAFMPEGDFITTYSNMLVSPTPETFNVLKSSIRDAMNTYAGLESMTESRKAVNPAPQPIPQTQQAVSSPKGYDAAQPGSNVTSPELTPLQQFASSALERIQKVLADKSTKVHREVISNVTEKQLKDLSDKGLVLDPSYRHSIENTAVAHNQKNHGSMETEEPRGQIAITEDDYARIPQILDSYDDIEVAGENKLGLQTIRYRKVFPDGTSYYLEEVRTRRKSLAFKTMYKLKKGSSGELLQENAVLSTPVTTPDSTSLLDKDTNISVKQVTDNQLAEDSYEASQDSMPKEVETEQVSDGTKAKIPYYRTSVPEIATSEASKARDAILRGDRNALMKADLSDFSEERYATIWNALKDRNAFDNVATRLSVGDEVEFVIDPTFPTYDNQPQILIRNKKNSDVLTVLSGQTSKYYGLGDVRTKILSDYLNFRNEHPNDLYTYGKTSRVWAKRPGLIDYDYSGAGEKGIADIPAYNENAPIVFIDRSGEAVVVHGSDKNAASKVSSSFNDAERNKNENKRGNLYYLSPDGTNKYIPIRLGVEHFKEETKDLDSPTFEDIRQTLHTIVELTANGNPDNYTEQNDKLHDDVIKKLSGLLDVHDLIFEIGDFENVGVALKIVENANTPNEKSTLRRADQITDDWLKDFMAEQDRSLQIRRKEDGSVQNLKALVEEGLITSNARMLRPKGVDFYINPWDNKAEKFMPVTDAERQAEEERVESPSIEPGDTKGSFDSDEGFGNRDDFDDLDEAAPEPRKAEEEVSTAPEPRRTQATENFSELKPETQEALQTKGYTEEEWNKMGPDEKEKILKCLSV